MSPNWPFPRDLPGGGLVYRYGRITARPEIIWKWHTFFVNHRGHGTDENPRSGLLHSQERNRVRMAPLRVDEDIRVDQSGRMARRCHASRLSLTQSSLAGRSVRSAQRPKNGREAKSFMFAGAVSCTGST